MTSMDDGIGRRTARLEPGIHVLTEQDVDDTGDAKTQYIRERVKRMLGAAATPSQLLSGLREVLRSHDAPYDGSPACIHGEVHGTVSSATVLVSATGGVRYEHAEGTPCVTPYDRVL